MTTSCALAAAQTEPQPPAIDENHLSRMTLGDRRLEREVLELFLRQTTILLDRIASAKPPLAAAAAHTLKGSARGIGAWRVARAAESLEYAAGGADNRDLGDRDLDGRDLDDRDLDDRDLEGALAELKAASLEAGAAIAARLTALFGELGGNT